jgi:hypothetical protein
LREDGFIILAQAMIRTARTVFPSVQGFAKHSA